MKGEHDREPGPAATGSPATGASTEARSHISVCICTFKRPEMLRETLRTLAHQRTDDLFTYSIVVADNDDARSGEPVVEAFRSRSAVRVVYQVEPNRNIAMARNKAVVSADGDYVAFIDDDEVATPEWLFHLYSTARAYGAHAVLGPVLPTYEAKPPDWVLKGGYFDRPRYPTGTPIPWPKTRTGNVLLAKEVFDGGATLFDPAFRHSEDQEFFKRVIARRQLVIWCDEGAVFERQGVDRFTVKYFLKRGLLRGNVSLRLQQQKAPMIGKALVALTLYTAALPFLAVVRRDLAILYLIKDCDHLGKLLAACRIDVASYLA